MVCSVLEQHLVLSSDVAITCDHKVVITVENLLGIGMTTAEPRELWLSALDDNTVSDEMAIPSRLPHPGSQAEWRKHE